MTGPATPGQEGPSYAPPPLPEGWIAQWDGMSRKYYFVQLSTGASQWETPAHAAPTGPTPQATPQGIEHPYGTPGQQEGEVVDNQDGTRSVRYADGRVEPLAADGERGLGSFAMNQLLGGGKKQSQGGLGQLGGLASQFLGGGSSHSNQGHSSGGGSAASGIVGALAGQLLGGGKKQDHQPQNYTGSQNQQQPQGGGLMGSLGGMFGGHSGGGQGSLGGNFGYSQHNNQQGGYTGSAPPTSYQPSGSAHTSYNPPPPPQQHPYANQTNSPSQSYGTPDNSYGQSPTHQQPPYGAPSSQQPSYGQPHSNQQQPSYGGSQQPPYGGIQHQPSYGSGHPPPQSQQYAPPPSYEGGAGGYGAPPNPQPGPYAEMSGGLYGNNGAPNIPTGSHPHHGQQHQPQGPPPNQGYGGPPGGYGGPQGRW